MLIAFAIITSIVRALRDSRGVRWNIPDTERRVIFKTSGYIIWGYMLTMRYFLSRKEIIREGAKYRRKLQKVFGPADLANLVRK